MDEAIEPLIAQIAPNGTTVAEAPIGDHEATLFPVEAAQIVKAVPSRRGEFATGRILARRALRAIGGPEIALISGTDRAPRWPDGFVGSITHTASRAAAAVARQADFAGIGIDIEIVSRISWRVMPRITTETERRVLETAADRQFLLALIFSAKEAWFKCQFPLTGVYLDFTDAEVTVDLAHSVFDVRRCPGVGGIDPLGWAQGRFARGDDLAATVVTLPSR
jgi:4'-phosphopantetheinyl transferase EntD